LFFLTLWIISIINVNENKKEDPGLVPQAQFTIVVKWDGTLNCDVDTYLMDGSGNIVMFRNKDAGLMHLDRDDTGLTSDSITMPDGSIVTYPDNREMIQIRGIVPGEHILNVHMYALRSVQAPVEVEVEIFNKFAEKIFSKTVNLGHQGDEKTILRFSPLQNGKLGYINYLERKFVGESQSNGQPEGNSSTRNILRRLFGN